LIVNLCGKNLKTDSTPSITKSNDPKSKVVSISSGKNFQFNMQEMIVAVEQKINLTIIVLNDSINNKYPGPNYKTLAESFNVRSTRVKASVSMGNTIKKFMGYKGVTLIEILI